MKNETKLNFLAIISTAIAVAIFSIAFTPIGAAIILIMIIVIAPNLKGS